MSDWTSSQADSAGKRLRDARATEADEAFFRQFLAAHDEVLASVVERLRRLAAPDGQVIEPTARVKTRETLLEKLRRERSRLSAVHDVAGSRIVISGTLTEQDTLATVVQATFPEQGRVIDRRADPRQGYRAVHVIGRRDGCWVEVQIRTQLQHLWAETFERLADRLGRGLRYGEETDNEATTKLVAFMQRWSEEVHYAEMTNRVVASMERSHQLIEELAEREGWDRRRPLDDSAVIHMREGANKRTAIVADALQAIRAILEDQ